MDDEAVKELSECVRKMEIAQVKVLEGLNTLTARSNDVLLEMKTHNGKIDNHEVRLAVRETAWREQIRPALARLHNLELKVAGSAVFGGAVVYLGSEVLKKVAGG